MFPLLRRSILLSLTALASVPLPSAAAGPSEIQKLDLAEFFGKWFVTSFEIAPIAAVSTDQAAAMVGKTAYFGRSIVEFGAQKCPDPRYQGASLGAGNATIDIIIDCPDGQIVPNLSYDRQSKQLSAVLDGAAYLLGREPPKTDR